MPVKPKYLYSNKSVKQTIADIWELLEAYEAEMFATIRDDKNGRVGVAFTWQGHSVQICIQPHKIHAVLQTMKKISSSQKTPEKAERMAFRLIYHWLENNFQLVSWQAMSIPEVFFAHSLMSDGKTVAEHFIEGGKIKALPQPVIDVEVQPAERR